MFKQHTGKGTVCYGSWTFLFSCYIYLFAVGSPFATTILSTPIPTISITPSLTSSTASTGN